MTFTLDDKAKIVMVTSSIPGEGKSTVAANLAMLSARRGVDTILVDGDLRKPVLHKIFEVPRQPGLNELQAEIRSILADRKIVGRYLGGDDRAGTDARPVTSPEGLQELVPIVESFFKSTPFENLRFLPSGSLNIDSTGIWFTHELELLLNILRLCAGMVILDMPPCLGLADANVASRHVDGVLFCVAAGETERRAIQRALANLDKMQAAMVGIVLNKVDQMLMYGGRKYYKYYTRYYSDSRA